MPSEPIEAEFAYPPILSKAQEEEYRTLDQEGPLSLHRALSQASKFSRGDLEAQDTATNTVVGTTSNEKVTVDDLAAQYRKEGVKLVDFEPGAGENPREWSLGRKCMEGAVKELNTTQEIVNLTVTCFVIGFGIGPLMFAPLSEVVGRKPIYSVSIFFYFIFTLPSALPQNAATLVVGRQLAGIAASAPMSNVGGTIADIWAMEDRGIPMAIFSGTLFLGPCLGPVVGGWIGERAGWRWIYWVLFILVGIAFLFTLVIPETYAPILLKHKAQRLRKETGDDSYNTLAEMERLPLKTSLKIALTRPLIMMFKEPIVLFMSFYLSFVYSLLYLLFFAFPLAFAEVRGWGLGMTDTSFISIMLGIILALCVLPYQETIYRKATAQGCYPEARLYPMLVGCGILPVALFIFAFTGGFVWVHWIAVCIAGALFGIAMILIYVSANSYIIDSYSSYAASAMAAKTLMRSIVGAMVPLFVTQMFHGMGFQYAGLLLALIACVITPIPFVFFWYGGRIRGRSRMANKALPGQGSKDEDLSR
ncbi:hypothetical protein DXG01_007388 [Tephrocybe rancida]|nr:hypothetical protein DXG01_007388 [Tephrocybe rancida]